VRRHSRVGHLRLTSDRFELWLVSETDEVVEVTLDLDPDTAAALRRVVAVHGHRDGCPRGNDRTPLLVRTLRQLGAIDPLLEVHHGRPPRFVLAVPGPWGHREIDLDLADATELILARRVPIVARGWPSRDWDTLLPSLAGEDRTGAAPPPERVRRRRPPA
jgi:hypothetical protein